MISRVRPYPLSSMRVPSGRKNRKPPSPVVRTLKPSSWMSLWWYEHYADSRIMPTSMQHAGDCEAKRGYQAA
jgi:hypothetical protein